ncbi:tetratricopeptide repeat protein [Sphingomonas sp. LB-2]|uniref:SPOR domain-containing protein n=1 Tax=Sphingomonas caeni TaxID=2984949 RepID=UPI0022325D59|nr:SPOR domain-containing protein [Sphingomonas caeni]MCW3848464.1 tetratricopeptide repeat protein [Sphingomonas caeni]
MKTRMLLSIGLSALVLTGAVGGAAFPGMMASAASAENPKRAASEAAAARKYMAKRKADKAVQHAELAVSFAPNVAEYRALLGQAYLLAGRFVSARQALTDALTLDPNNGPVALNLALSQIAQGDWSGARHTLDAHDNIAASDRGLAYALAGDPMRAIEILEPASRAADASPKTRQNLALSLALAGRWADAKTVASIDLSPADVDARIMQWASFARPANAYDQVASLLGVRPIQDAGQPTALALVVANPNVGVAAAEVPAPVPVPDPVDTYMPGTPSNAAEVATQVSAETGVDVAAVEPQTPVESGVEPVAVAGTTPSVVFGPRAEIVQAVSLTPVRPAPLSVVRPAAARVAAVRVPAAAPQRVSYAKGNFYVQLGAYDSPGVARDAWARTSRRIPALGRHTPQGANISTGAGNFYRLSVGGFARNDADSLCRTVRASGQTCFVRAGAGDRVASWIRPNETRLASR